jgi:hypothetical protein
MMKRKKERKKEQNIFRLLIRDSYRGGWWALVKLVMNLQVP